MLWLTDVGVDEQAVHLGVDVLHHDLEAIETASLGYLNLTAKAFNQVLIDNSITGCEEGQDMGDEVAFIIVKAVVPVVEILGQVHLLGSPEGCLSLLVHLPYFMVPGCELVLLCIHFTRDA